MSFITSTIIDSLLERKMHLKETIFRWNVSFKQVFTCFKKHYKHFLTAVQILYMNKL